MKKKRKIIITALVLSSGCTHFSSTSTVINQLTGDECTAVQIVQTTKDESCTEVISNDSQIFASFTTSFEFEKSIISKIEMMTSSEFSNSELDEEIGLKLSDPNIMLSVVNYLEAKEDDNLLVLVARMYINLVSNRPIQIIDKLIDYCFSSKSVSTISFGIDLLSLHSSSAATRRYLNREFSHPFLIRKMNQLKSEALS